MEAAHRCDSFNVNANRGSFLRIAPGCPSPQNFYNTKSSRVSISSRRRPSPWEFDTVPNRGTDGTFSDNVMSCGVVVDKVLQQCTLLTYPDDPLSNPVYPICEVALPYPGHCASPQLKSTSENRLDAYFAQNCRTVRQRGRDQCHAGPGNGLRMSGRQEMVGEVEKAETVDSWIESVPIHEIDKHQWESGCYYSNFSSDWEEEEVENSSSKSYFQTTDELLYFLAKRFEAVVCKLYQLEKEPADMSD